jgi:DNA mismatch repair protein MutS
LPGDVIDRAKEILTRLEGEGRNRDDLSKATGLSERAEPVQMALFASVDRKLREELRRIDVTQLTPMEAMNLLHRLSEEAKK